MISIEKMFKETDIRGRRRVIYTHRSDDLERCGGMSSGPRLHKLPLTPTDKGHPCVKDRTMAAIVIRHHESSGAFVYIESKCGETCHEPSLKRWSSAIQPRAAGLQLVSVDEVSGDGNMGKQSDV